MPTPSDFATAVNARNPDMLRNALIKRCIYVFGEGEDPQDFTANEAGTVPLAVGLYDTRTIFWLAPDDFVSVHDGVAIIVTSDNYRYHATDFRWPTSILGVQQNTPAGSPEIGDAYHTGPAPTGAWSGHPAEIAIWTSRGWVFMSPPIGLLFFNEADGIHYFRNASNNFVTIAVVPGSNTVRDGALIGGQRRFIVENQTTNTPPTPIIGVYHIVGPSPTGAWTGQTGKIATSYDNSTFTFITPTEGVEAYDKAQNANYLFDSVWLNAAGGFVDQTSAGTAASANIDATGSAGETAGYAWNATTAPTSTSPHRGDETITLTYAATNGSSILEFEYAARLAISAGTTTITDIVIGLFRDAETNAVDWQWIGVNVIDSINALFRISAGDTSSHTYRVRIFVRGNSGAGMDPTIAVSRRRMFLREAT